MIYFNCAKCTDKVREGVQIVSPKMGQKITDNPKDKRVEIRLDDETLEKLDYLVSEEDSDRSKVIRKGIEIQYNQKINKKE